MTDKLRGIEQLHPRNHDLWHKVQRLVALRMTWEQIALDCGLVGPSAAKELVDWVLEYKGEKRLPMVRAVHPETNFSRTPKTPNSTASAQKFLAWRQQHEGARKALEAMGK